MRPWVARQLEAQRACQAAGQELLARAARQLDLSPADRAEAERLIALPYGAEGFALRRFVATHTRLENARCVA